jgi:DeoR/GlpR family transcriptional regulator of sugar metabolism
MKTAAHRTLATERWARLRALIRANRVVRVEELTDALGVSAATIRRDLEELERLGELRRVHGGAVSLGDRLVEPLFDEKATIRPREKQAIAAAAVAYINPNDTIYLDGGSTVLELARLLFEREDVTVVTNSLRAAYELAGSGPRVILVGGELRRLSQTFVGPLTRLMLEGLHLQKAFMGTIGLTIDGPTTTDPNEAYTKALVCGRADAVYLLADSSKLGKVALAQAGALQQITTLITDHGAEAVLLDAFRERGVDVIVA